MRSRKTQYFRYKLQETTLKSQLYSRNTLFFQFELSCRSRFAKVGDGPVPTPQSECVDYVKIVIRVLNPLHVWASWTRPGNCGFSTTEELQDD